MVTNYGFIVGRAFVQAELLAVGPQSSAGVVAFTMLHHDGG
jgi:hypothetical protein